MWGKKLQRNFNVIASRTTIVTQCKVSYIFMDGMLVVAV